MSAQLLSSKIVVQEEPPSLRTIQNVESGVLAAVGLSEMGPVGVATLVTSFEEFVRIFGGDYEGYAVHAMRGYFGGGGHRAYFTRVVHYTNLTDATTKTSAPGRLTLRTTASAPSVAAIVSPNIGPYDVEGGTLTVAVNGGAPISIQFIEGTVADLNSATFQELKTLIENSVTGVVVNEVSGRLQMSTTTTGLTASLHVTATPGDLGFDSTVRTGNAGDAEDTLHVSAQYDGAFSARLFVLITPATSQLAHEFNLSVVRNSVVVERFTNLSMLRTSARFVETIINAVVGGSSLLVVSAAQQATNLQSALQHRPANSAGNPPMPFGPMTGGNDGFANLAESDFVGDAASRLGFRSFDTVQDIDLLIAPDAPTPAVQNAALSYVSVQRNQEVFFIADPPAAMNAAGIIAYVSSNGLTNATESGAIYWPRVKVLNPNKSLYGDTDTIVVPPSGHIAGMFARNDSARVGGIYDAPGGVERGLLPGVIGFETETVLDEAVRDLIAPYLINPITKLRGQPIAVNDVMTLKSGGSFPTIAERRGVSHIERAIKDGLQFARLRNHDEALRDEVERTLEAYLLGEMRSGAFRSKDPSKAFFVDVGEALNPPSEQFAGRLNVRVGLATQKPARFIIFSFSQDTRAIDEELAAVGG